MRDAARRCLRSRYHRIRTARRRTRIGIASWYVLPGNDRAAYQCCVVGATLALVERRVDRLSDNADSPRYCFGTDQARFWM